MQMPVVVGVIVSIIFLVVFSEWFFHTALGWNEIVLDDVYYKYRVAGAAIFSLLILGSTMMVMAYITECPNENREGVFERLNCQEYQKIRMVLGKNSDSSASDLPLQPAE